VRIVDVYSYLEGAGLAEMLSQIADTALEHNDAFSLRDVMNRVRELRQQGKPAEAIAELGKLSPEMQQLRYIRILRAGLAKAMSQADYLRELDELAKAFPDDPAVALVEIDGAVLHGDYAAALHDIDIVDKDVGGDAFQDAVRADVYLKQGDIAKAAARAEAAVKAEPTLPRAWYAKLDVLLHEGDWPGALAVIDRLATLGSRLTDAGMRKVKAFDELLATPEYAAWHDAHP